MQINEIRALIEHDLGEVEKVIADNVQSDVPLIPTISMHLINSGGKRLRPMISLISAGCFGLTPASGSVTKLAAVIEFIHTATLLHDDVIDDSELRRGKKTANAIWDNSASVLVGDFLFSRAFQMMVDIDCMPVMALLSNTTNTIAEGEVMQLGTRHNPETTESEYLQIIRNKTGILFSAAAKGVAILAQASDECTSALADYGLNLGIAFQIIDDALDYEANEQKLGKTLGDDLAEGKATLPILYALRVANAKDKTLLSSSLREGKRESLSEIIAIIEKSGAHDYISDLANQYCHNAKSAISVLPASQYRDALIAIADFSISRDY